MSSDSACNWRGCASGCAPDAISISAHQSAKAKSAHPQNQRKHNQRSLKISQSKISAGSLKTSQSKISAASPISKTFESSSSSSVAFFSPSTRDQHAREHKRARTFVGEGHADGALFGCALALKKSAQISAHVRTCFALALARWALCFFAGIKSYRSSEDLSAQSAHGANLSNHGTPDKEIGPLFGSPAQNTSG